MKKKVLIAFSSIVLLFLVVVVLNPPQITIEDNELVAPKRPTSVPEDTFWIGGIDGGNYISIEKDKDDLYFAKIYNDYTGSIEYEGKLKILGSQTLQGPVSDSLLYQGWDGENLHLSNGHMMTIFPKNKN